MSWQNRLKGDALDWLLEPDPPGVRYLALKSLVDCPSGDPQLLAARQAGLHPGSHCGGPGSHAA